MSDKVEVKIGTFWISLWLFLISVFLFNIALDLENLLNMVSK